MFYLPTSKSPIHTAPPLFGTSQPPTKRQPLRAQATTDSLQIRFSGNGPKEWLNPWAYLDQEVDYFDDENPFQLSFYAGVKLLEEGKTPEKWSLGEQYLAQAIDFKQIENPKQRERAKSNAVYVALIYIKGFRHLEPNRSKALAVIHQLMTIPVQNSDELLAKVNATKLMLMFFPDELTLEGKTNLIDALRQDVMESPFTYGSLPFFTARFFAKELNRQQDARELFQYATQNVRHLDYLMTNWGLPTIQDLATGQNGFSQDKDSAEMMLAKYLACAESNTSKYGKFNMKLDAARLYAQMGETEKSKDLIADIETNSATLLEEPGAQLDLAEIYARYLNEPNKANTILDTLMAKPFWGYKRADYYRENLQVLTLKLANLFARYLNQPEKAQEIIEQCLPKNWTEQEGYTVAEQALDLARLNADCFGEQQKTDQIIAIAKEGVYQGRNGSTAAVRVKLIEALLYHFKREEDALDIIEFIVQEAQANTRYIDYKEHTALLENLWNCDQDNPRVQNLIKDASNALKIKNNVSDLYNDLL